MKLPNYYSILPASVRYSEVLSDFEKILYSEIVALSNAFGFCFASNSYFAKIYKKSDKTISRAINNLSAHDYVKIHIDQESGNTRHIYVIIENYYKLEKESENIKKGIESQLDRSLGGIDKNVHSPMDKNVYHNNTSLNTYIKHAREDVNIQELFSKLYGKKL